MLDSELSHLSDDRKVIVFVNTKRQCDAVQRHLEPQGYNCAVLHGGKDQNQREASLLGFREGRYNVLIATDVAGELCRLLPKSALEGSSVCVSISGLHEGALQISHRLGSIYSPGIC